MSRSFFAAIRSAVVSAPEPIAQQGDEAGAIAPEANALSGQIMENVMADDQTKSGATTATGIPQATHDAAVSAARTDGEAAGAKATTDKFAAIIAADGIKGNATRMAAAIDLAVKSPGMSAEDVAAFVSTNIAIAPAAPAAALANRIAASGGADPLAGSDQPDPAKAQASWATAVSQANTRFGKDAA